ncbi:uncharacterized protein Dmul_03950 [Desulfococcus multivorans]|nr:uncharacterized protein Dmul_03950 [Desulfococcus multivorans]
MDQSFARILRTKKGHPRIDHFRSGDFFCRRRCAVKPFTQAAQARSCSPSTFAAHVSRPELFTFTPSSKEIEKT